MSRPETRIARNRRHIQSGADEATTSHGSPLQSMEKSTDPTWLTVEDFVKHHVAIQSKRRHIKKVLISTNGIAAMRFMTSIRKQLMHQFNSGKVVKFICLTTEQEIQSNAEYLKQADGIVIAPNGDNKDSYATVDEIVAHAIEQKVDAVWAGWGHASENPELPRKLLENDIIFMGPPRDAMFSLGDKIASTMIAQSVKIPTIEWSGSGLVLDEVVDRNEDGVISVSDDLYAKACVSNAADGLAAVEQHKIAYPLMIKASEGRGGKGIRKVPNEMDFNDMFLAVQAEVPGSPIFIMKCVENARHIEVQLIADTYGTVIPACIRDCSVQRRWQKIIEEAPASIAPSSVLQAMQEDAVRLAKLVGYESAGTVEYMYLPEENKYFFLELNPSLQVEHPCTEMISNINIPGIQLQIAMGLPLHRIVDIRYFYGFRESQLYEDTPLPPNLVKSHVDQHCIAARITSEDPEDYFRPSTGSVKTLDFKSSQDVVGYFSVSSSGISHEFADSQFGHLFAIGRNREEAISKMRCALQELNAQATFASQISYLGDILNDPDFVENRFNTQWLDSRIATGDKKPAYRFEVLRSSMQIGKVKKAKSAKKQDCFKLSEMATVTVNVDCLRGGTTQSAQLHGIPLFVAEVFEEFGRRPSGKEWKDVFRSTMSIAKRNEFFSNNSNAIAGRSALNLSELTLVEMADLVKTFLRKIPKSPFLLSESEVKGIANNVSEDGSSANGSRGRDFFLFIMYSLSQLCRLGHRTMEAQNLATLWVPVLLEFPQDPMAMHAMVGANIQTFVSLLKNPPIIQPEKHKGRSLSLPPSKPSHTKERNRGKSTPPGSETSKKVRCRMVKREEYEQEAPRDGKVLKSSSRISRKMETKPNQEKVMEQVAIATKKKDAKGVKMGASERRAENIETAKVPTSRSEKDFGEKMGETQIIMVNKLDEQIKGTDKFQAGKAKSEPPPPMDSEEVQKESASGRVFIDTNSGMETARSGHSKGQTSSGQKPIFSTGNTDRTKSANGDGETSQSKEGSTSSKTKPQQSEKDTKLSQNVKKIGAESETVKKETEMLMDIKDNDVGIGRVLRNDSKNPIMVAKPKLAIPPLPAYFNTYQSREFVAKKQIVTKMLAKGMNFNETVMEQPEEEDEKEVREPRG